MKYIWIILLFTALTAACQRGPVAEGTPAGNIFQDTVFQRIYTLQNQRDSGGLAKYLQDKNPAYRKAAALGFASVQSLEAVDPLARLLTDSSPGVRSAAAYSLGQTGDHTALPYLIKAYKTEQDEAVKRDILEAVGKCGDETGLSFITGLEIDNRWPLLQEGQAWGLYRFSLRRITSEPGTVLALQLLGQEKAAKVRFIAANYLMRARLDLTPYHKQLLQAFEEEKHLFTRLALAGALGHARHPEVLERLKGIVSAETNADYRLIVNSINALGRFEYGSVKEILLKTAAHPNVNAAVSASEYFLAHGRESDADRYFEIAQTLPNWRARANMLTAALQYAAEPAKKKTISQWIIRAYTAAADSYEKAHLLKALSGDIANFSFVEKETFASIGKETVLSTYGTDALAIMSQSVKENREKLQGFARVFERAILSRDSAMISLTAAVLRDPQMNFKTIYNDTGFLTRALNNCKMPEDIEAWLDLKKTIDYFSGTADENQTPPTTNQPIDWKFVTSIPPDQEVRIKTSRGDITIRLLVNHSPGSVANFLKLIQQDYYKKSVFHRVVPNFVIQDGCPRGDGWGGPSFTIGSELGPLYYGEGSVGMASAGKDTEGSQWFITHSPTPHLDGRYTIFAEVTDGMDVVHRIEIGDKIQEFELNITGTNGNKR